jgi:hypothetical protein
VKTEKANLAGWLFFGCRQEHLAIFVQFLFDIFSV